MTMESIFAEETLEKIFTSYLTKGVLDRAFSGLKNAISRINKGQTILSITKIEHVDYVEFVKRHLEENIRWATNISFRDTKKAKNINDIFVELDLNVKPVRLKLEVDEKINEIPALKLLTDTDKNVVLLGQPGAGKTTTVKKIFLETILKEYEIYETFNCPILIRLKDLRLNDDSNGLVLLTEVLSVFGVFLNFENKLNAKSQEKVIIHIFKEFIERLDVLIILDGFDEVSDLELRSNIIRNLRLITNSMISSRFILTCRSADYEIHIENSFEYEISPLKEYQIENFVKKWILNDRSEELLSQLKLSPYWDTTMRPLTLAHLCAIFEYNNSIPDRPKSVYKKIIHLLLEDWSNQRSINRVSVYSNFDVDRKFEFLSRMAYVLTVEYGRVGFNRNTLLDIYSMLYSDFELPKSDCDTVVNEIESHNGLILQVGADNYEFAHKSLQEYLAADYLVRLPSLIDDIKSLLLIPNELAILTSISASPNLTFFNLVCKILKENCIISKFLRPFLDRLKIEKPDYSSDLLFSVTMIYIMNEIAKKIASIRVKQEKLMDYGIDEYSDKEQDKYEKEIEELHYCLKHILSYNGNESFRKSLRDFKNHYLKSKVTHNSNSKFKELELFGKNFLFSTSRDSSKILSTRVELPKKLILVEIFENETENSTLSY